jgi:uncharacterized protein DUF4019
VPAKPSASAPQMSPIAAAVVPPVAVAPPMQVASVPPRHIDAPQVHIDAPGISPERLHKAHQAVSEWLELRDQGRYFKAWNESTFIIPREAWRQSQEMLHDRRGNVTSRRLVAEELSPARNPERMLFRYRTEFEKGPPANEFVFVIPEASGHWAVSGYFVRLDNDRTALP